jgi:hypothetical protein
VFAEVFRMPKSGSWATPTSICQLLSNDSGSQLTLNTSCFSSAADTNSYIYFAIVKITRTVTTGTLEFDGLELY